METRRKRTKPLNLPKDEAKERKRGQNESLSKRDDI